MTAALAVLGPAPPGAASGDAPAAPDQGLQVTIFGIVARPGDSKIDRKLAPIAVQLRNLKPGHGFQLRGHKSERAVPGEVVRCDLGDDLTAEAKLQGLEPTGKARIQFTLTRKDKPELTTTVITPLNQLFFCEKPLPDDTRLLIGIGAR
jgi:hypothetical protein